MQAVSQQTRENATRRFGSATVLESPPRNQKAYGTTDALTNSVAALTAARRLGVNSEALALQRLSGYGYVCRRSEARLGKPLPARRFGYRVLPQSEAAACLMSSRLSAAVINPSRRNAALVEIVLLR